MPRNVTRAPCSSASTKASIAAASMGSLEIVPRTSGMGAAARDLGDEVIEQTVENREAVAHSAGRARQVDDDRAVGGAGEAAAERGGRRERDSGGANGLGDSRQLAVEQGARGLRRLVGGA